MSKKSGPNENMITVSPAQVQAGVDDSPDDLCGTPKQPGPQPDPSSAARLLRTRVAVIMLHGRCNMFCTFCINDRGMECMTWSEAVSLLRRLRDSGVQSVVLGGGEPFIWPGDVVALAQRAKSMGLLVQVGTNALHLPADYAELTCIDRWVLPLESAAAPAHNRLRLAPGAGGHHAIMQERLEMLGRAGRSVTLSTVITAPNLSEIDSLTDWIAAYHLRHRNVHAWHLYQFLPFGVGGAVYAEELAIDAWQYDGIIASIRARDLPFRVYRRSDMARAQTVAFFTRRGGKVVSGDAAWDHLLTSASCSV